MGIKKHNWEIALEKTLANVKTPTSKPKPKESKAPSRQFRAVKGSTVKPISFDSNNPVHTELASKHRDKVFVTETGVNVDRAAYQTASKTVQKRRERAK